MQKQKSYIWLNGNIINIYKNTDFSGNLRYQPGVFEIIKIYNNKIFKLKAHIERLFLSSKSLMMKIDFSTEEIEQACRKLVENNKIINGYIRLLVSIGSKNNIDVIISCWEQTINHFNNLINKPLININISPYIKTSSNSSHITKATSLLSINHLARKKAIADGFDDSIILDYRGYVTETTNANFFMVKQDIIYTPTIEYCLDGITRRTIIEIAQKEGIKVKETNLLKEDLAMGDEAFTTSTPTGITSILSIENILYKKNHVTNFLYSKYYQLTQELT